MDALQQELYKICKCEKPDIEKAKMLLEQGITLNEAICDEKLTHNLQTSFLCCAIEGNHEELMQLLVSYSADPNFLHEWGSALWDLRFLQEYEPDTIGAEARKRLHMTEFLLRNGADPNIVWEDECLLDHVCFDVFNDVGAWDWYYLVEFFKLLLIFGGTSSYCSPKVYMPIDTEHPEKYTLYILGGYGEIVDENHNLVATI